MTLPLVVVGLVLAPPTRLVARRPVGRPGLIERGQGALALVLDRLGHRRQRIVERPARIRRLPRPIIPRRQEIPRHPVMAITGRAPRVSYFTLRTKLEPRFLP
jgi:hypothetical protein